MDLPYTYSLSADNNCNSENVLEKSVIIISFDVGDVAGVWCCFMIQYDINAVL